MIKKITALILSVCVALCAFTGCKTADGAPATADDAPTPADVPAAPVREPLSDVVPVNNGDSFDCTYAGDKHTFSVYLPENGGEGSPLIIMLHGFGNSIVGFRTQTHMDEQACARGYTVVYAGSAASGWNSGADSSDKDDLGFLVALAEHIVEQYGCDSERVYAAGFSNGGFMIHRLAAEASDTFRAVCCVAGLMPRPVWEQRSDMASISFMQIYGTKDDVVPMNATGSADSSIHPAIEDVMSYWAAANGLDKSSSVSLSDKAVMTEYSGGASDNIVSTVVIDGGRHSWPQESFAGFDADSVILDFFDRCDGK